MRRAVLQWLESWQAAGVKTVSPVVAHRQSIPIPQSLAAGTASSTASASPANAVNAVTVNTAVVSSHAAVAGIDRHPETGAIKKSASSLTQLSGRCDTFQPLELSREDRVSRLDALRIRVAQCQRCPELASTRRQTVFGVGNPQARILFIGEAPGADEDQQGEPFVGRAGQLLNDIIKACRMRRDEIYICNILRCRPPGNRLPAFIEAENCREYLDGQLAIVNPEYIVCWGACAARNLLGTEEAIGKLRGRFYHYGRAKVVCTYHPSYLLRNPAAKKDVWQDMKFLFQDMGIDLMAKS